MHGFRNKCGRLYQQQRIQVYFPGAITGKSPEPPQHNVRNAACPHLFSSTLHLQQLYRKFFLFLLLNLMVWLFTVVLLQFARTRQGINIIRFNNPHSRVVIMRMGGLPLNTRWVLFCAEVEMLVVVVVTQDLSAQSWRVVPWFLPLNVCVPLRGAVRFIAKLHCT